MGLVHVEGERKGERPRKTVLRRFLSATERQALWLSDSRPTTDLTQQMDIYTDSV